MNKLKKVLLILFVFIVTLVIVIALNKTDVISEIVEVAESETLASSTTSVTSFKSSTQDISSFYDDTVTIDGDEYYYIGTTELDDYNNSSGSGIVFLRKNWWVLCSSEGHAMRHVTVYFSDKKEVTEVSPAQAYLLAYLQNVNSGTYRDTGQYDWWNLGSGSVITSAVAQTQDESDLPYDINIINEYLSGTDENFTVSSFKISASDLADGGELSGYLSTILEIMKNDSSSGYDKSWSNSEKRTNAAKYATNMVKSFTSYSEAKKANDIWCELIIWGIEQTGYVEGSSSWDGYSLETALGFESYILGVFDVNDVSDITYTYYTVDGTEVRGYDIDGKIKESFEFVDTEVEVSFTQEADNSGENANTYKIGPYKLEYIYYPGFCYISSSTLQLVDSNGGTITLNEDEFHFESTADSGLDSNGFPTPGSDFYVVFEYDEDIQGIANLSFKLEYMNGAGSFTTYSTQQWVCTYCNSYEGYVNAYHVHCSLCDEVIYAQDSSYANESFASHTHKYCKICKTYDTEWDSETHTHTYCSLCDTDGEYSTFGSDVKDNLNKYGFDFEEDHIHYYCSVCQSYYTDYHYHCSTCYEERGITNELYFGLDTSGKCGSTNIQPVYESVTETYYECGYSSCSIKTSTEKHYHCPACDVVIGSSSTQSGIVYTDTNRDGIYRNTPSTSGTTCPLCQGIAYDYTIEYTYEQNVVSYYICGTCR